MTIMETKFQIEKRLKNLFDNKNHDGVISFINSNGVPFHVVVMGEKEPWNFIVIEYEDTGEDGDAFYPTDYADFEILFNSIVNEINAA